MIGIATADHVKSIFFTAVGEDDFSAERSSVRALYSCVFPGKPSRELRKADLTPDIRQAVEQTIQGLVYQVASDAEAAGKLTMEYAAPESRSRSIIPRLFDMALALGDNNFLEPGFIFTMIERLVEVTLVPEECHRLIDWVVGNKEKLKRNHIFDRGKLILLRTVNRMLKILQRGEDCTYHSGRLLFFMSELYPIAERSATNHSGLRDMAHPVKIYNWTDILCDDFGRLVDKQFYELYWKTMEYVQRNVGSEAEAMRIIDTIYRLLDSFKDCLCRRDVPSALKSNVTFMNNGTPEQFNDILSIYLTLSPVSGTAVYVYVQRLLAASKNPVVTSDSARQRLSATLVDIEQYVRSDGELKQRWEPIRECLVQENSWIEWKNADAKDWTLPPVDTAFWDQPNTDPIIEQDLIEIHTCLDDDGNYDIPIDLSDSAQKEKDAWDMKSSKGISIHFDRDLELPDFEELRVPVAKEFLGKVLADPEEMEESMEILELDASFCWKTYRLLSEHDIQHMVNAEHRTNFAKLLKAMQSTLDT